jgi:hypothetical protein
MAGVNGAVRSAVVVFGMLLAVSVTACSPGLIAPTLHEAIPLPGSFYLTAEPADAPGAFSIRYLSQGGDVSGISDDFPPGARIVAQRSTLPGRWGVLLNGGRCDGSFDIETEIETDVVLHIAADGCRIEAVGSHPEGAVTHGIRPAELALRAPIGGRISARPLDGQGELRVVSVDESGHAYIDGLAPGRYEVSLLLGGRVTSSITIKLEANEYHSLTLGE